jgi:hypothetical protein
MNKSIKTKRFMKESSEGNHLPWNECNDTLDETVGDAVLWEISIDSHKNSTTTENYNMDDVVTGVIRGGFFGND